MMAPAVQLANLTAMTYALRLMHAHALPAEPVAHARACMHFAAVPYAARWHQEAPQLHVYLMHPAPRPSRNSDQRRRRCSPRPRIATTASVCGAVRRAKAYASRRHRRSLRLNCLLRATVRVSSLFDAPPLTDQLLPCFKRSRWGAGGASWRGHEKATGGSNNAIFVLKTSLCIAVGGSFRPGRAAPLPRDGAKALPWLPPAQSPLRYRFRTIGRFAARLHTASEWQAHPAHDKRPALLVLQLLQPLHAHMSSLQAHRAPQRPHWS